MTGAEFDAVARSYRADCAGLIAADGRRDDRARLLDLFPICCGISAHIAHNARILIITHISGRFARKGQTILARYTPALNRTVDALKRKRAFADYSGAVCHGMLVSVYCGGMSCAVLAV